MLSFLRPPFTPKLVIERQQFTTWLASPEGHALLAAEKRALESITPSLAGNRAVQIGLTANANLLHDCKHPWRWRLSTLANSAADLAVDAAHLPLASRSVNLLVLHHCLDFDNQPYRIVAEATRVLAVGGTLLIVGFNPLGLMGFQRFLRSRRNPPWSARFLRAGRVGDWAGVCGCRPLGYVTGGYSQRDSRLDSWLEALLWKRFGGFYVLIVSRQAYPLKPLLSRRHLLVDLPTNVITVPAARWQQTRSSFEASDDL